MALLFRQSFYSGYRGALHMVETMIPGCRLCHIFAVENRKKVRRGVMIR